MLGNTGMSSNLIRPRFTALSNFSASECSASALVSGWAIKKFTYTANTQSFPLATGHADVLISPVVLCQAAAHLIRAGLKLLHYG